jgi:hypothetical protein
MEMDVSTLVPDPYDPVVRRGAWRCDHCPPLTSKSNPFRFASRCARATNNLLLLSLPDGTHVTGTIGGRVFGVAKNTTLHCVKVMNDNGSGAASDIITGINVSAAQALATGRPAVISMSLGGPPNISIDNAVRILPVNY